MGIRREVKIGEYFGTRFFGLRSILESVAISVTSLLPEHPALLCQYFLNFNMSRFSGLFLSLLLGAQGFRLMPLRMTATENDLSEKYTAVPGLENVIRPSIVDKVCRMNDHLILNLYTCIP